jgi:anti-sigma factor RsiW
MQSLSTDDPTMASAENVQAVVARLIAGVAVAMLAAGLAAAWSMSSAIASDSGTHSYVYADIIHGHADIL